MLAPNVVEELLDFLPAKYHAQAVVAGGYAADPAQAEDIDLWVINVPVEQFDEVEQDIRGYLKFEHFLSQGADLLSTPAGDLAYANHPGQFRVIHEGFAKGAKKPVQIIITCQPTPLHLVRSFDITTHQIAFALAEPEQPIRSATYRTPLDQPRVTDFTRPQHTLLRFEKISKRYGYEPHPQDVDKLTGLMNQERQAA